MLCDLQKNLIVDLKRDGKFPIPWTSAIGLIEKIKELGDDIIGCEIGVSYGSNLVYFLDMLPNLNKVYAINPYISYFDGPVGLISEDEINIVKGIFLQNITPYENRVEFLNFKSSEAHLKIEDNSLDYIFIDGDHNYEAVYSDLTLYYDKVKVGGIFSGHDWNWGVGQPVQKAVHRFFAEKNIDLNKLKFCLNDVWYIYK